MVHPFPLLSAARGALGFSGWSLCPFFLTGDRYRERLGPGLVKDGRHLALHCAWSKTNRQRFSNRNPAPKSGRNSAEIISSVLSPWVF
jgi:hypothetical protein